MKPSQAGSPQQPRGPGGALPYSVSRGSPGDSRPAGSKPLGSVLERPSKDLAVEQAPGGNLLRVDLASHTGGRNLLFL